MLVLGRKLDESIMVGDSHTAIVQLTDDEIAFLKQLNDRGLLSFSARMLASLGKPLEIQMVKIEPDKVRLGIKGPKDIPIHRSEIWAQIQREGAAAK